ncbi:MAG: hypothetical protein GY796_05990, partial [Chloroflexi bacterium]|nr:hypothetical protein [Chloroflexota bacterium]
MKAKRNLPVYLLGGVVVILLLMFFITQQTSAGVGPTLRSLLGYPPLSTTESETKGNETTPNEMPTPSREDISALPDAPVLVPVEDEQRQQNEVALAVLTELVSKAEAQYFTPGWWYILSEREAFLT